MKKDAPRKFIQEFKAFAMKGNVADLAIAVVIGGAFGKIVNSLVSDIITPLASMATSGFDISKKVYVLREASGDVPALELGYGAFIQSGIDFLIIAFSVFCAVKLLGRLHRKQAEEAAAEAAAEEPKRSEEAELLSEIRDLLKQERQG